MCRVRPPGAMPQHKPVQTSVSLWEWELHSQVGRWHSAHWGTVFTLDHACKTYSLVHIPWQESQHSLEGMTRGLPLLFQTKDAAQCCRPHHGRHHGFCACQEWAHPSRSPGVPQGNFPRQDAVCSWAFRSPWKDCAFQGTECSPALSLPEPWLPAQSLAQREYLINTCQTKEQMCLWQMCSRGTNSPVFKPSFSNESWTEVIYGKERYRPYSNITDCY